MATRNDQAAAARAVATTKTITLPQAMGSETFKKELAILLPSHIEPQRLIAQALWLVKSDATGNLAKCSVQSVINAVRAAAVTGLELNGPLGHAYLVPFANQATFMPGYRGLIDLMVRGGGAVDVRAHVVYDGDDFEIRYGTAAGIHHIPRFMYDENDEDHMVGAYMVATMPHGGHFFDYLPKSGIMKRKAASRTSGKPDSPWQKWPAEMWKKTVVRHGAKFVPISSERLAAALEMDTRTETGGREILIPNYDDSITVEAAILEQTQNNVDDLKKQLAAKTEEVQQRVQQEKEPAPRDEADEERAAIQTVDRSTEDIDEAFERAHPRSAGGPPSSLFND